jgi:hypothetical protein
MPTPSIYSTDACNECELQVAARCPRCKHRLCMDHFPLGSHEPCASYLRASAAERVCYVCGVEVAPHQWSTAMFAHYIDSQKCAGCGLYICDARHTQLHLEVVRMAREKLRSNRYHVSRRYCQVCAPVWRLGGIVGATWWGAGIFLAATAWAFLANR